MLIIFLQNSVVSEALSISPADEVWPITTRDEEIEVDCKRLRWDLLHLGDKVPAKLIFPLLVAHLLLVPHGKFCLRLQDADTAGPELLHLGRRTSTSGWVLKAPSNSWGTGASS